MKQKSFFFDRDVVLVCLRTSVWEIRYQSFNFGHKVMLKH